MPPKSILVAIPLPPSFLIPRCTLSKSFNATQNRSFGIRSIEKPRPNPYNEGIGLPTLLASQKAALQRLLVADTLPHRTGALAIKKGMTAVYDRETGERIPCTILQLDQNQVVSHKTLEKHGYSAVCVGAGDRAAKNITKPMLGHFSAQGVPPKRYQQEFRVRDDTGLLAVGEIIKADWFIEGQFVDTRSHTKGKGFAGVMKRWGFHGQNRSHGPSLSHRSMGSAGPSQGGGSRVYPGKKMSGNMGGQRNTIQNVKVIQTDAERGIVVVKGAVSGPKGCLVMLQDALKKPWPDVPPPPSPAELNKEKREAVGAKGTKTAETQDS